MPDDFTTVNGQPLFHGAIMQSGSFSAWGSTPMKVAQSQYAGIMTEISCDIDDVDCLIGADTSVLQKAFSTTNNWLYPECRDSC
jgi:hypothetical protein